MFKNYLKIALRSMRKNKIITSINIFGLTVGIVFATLIFMWVADEMSYDSFHENNGRIYKVLVQFDEKGDFNAKTPGLLAAAIKREIPEVKYAARVLRNMRNPYKYKDKAFYENQSYCADADFFKMFTFPVLKGNQDIKFKNPNDLVISERTAKKYFGNENPIGKIMSWNNWGSYKVCAVLQNMPGNSSFQMELIEPHTLSEKYWKGGYNWRNYIHETYIMTKKNTNIAPITLKIAKMLNENKNIGNHLYNVKLQPLIELHQDNTVAGNTAATIDKQYIPLFLLIAIGILLIACINFINITSANSLTRAKEVGIRKVIGAERKAIIFQFIGEFSISTFVAAVISILIIQLFLPSFNQFTAKDLTFNINLIGYLLAVIIFTGSIAGIYPALYLSKFTPNDILKNKPLYRTKNFSWQSVFVVIQFSISIFLIIATFVINGQIDYMHNKNLGFAKDNILYIPAKAKLAINYESVKSRLLENPQITSVTMQNSVPTTSLNSWLVKWQGCTNDNLVVTSAEVTPDYFSTMEIKLKEGRLFSSKMVTDKNEAFILNEEAVNFLGINAPIGKEIRAGGREGQIIGVVKNSYFKSLHNKIEPLIYIPLNNYKKIDLFGIVLIKYKGKNISKIISEVKNIWKEFNPQLPFEYHFLDQTIESQYNFEQKLKVIFTWFSFLAIGISALGLLGLSILLMEQRIKEIGIRKVLGASIQSILILISKDFIKWILLSSIIATPFAYFALSKWLEKFAYRIDLTIWPFIISGALALLIAMITIVMQAIKTANTNPIDSIKYE